MFRTRQQNGVLFSVKSFTDLERYLLEVGGGGGGIGGVVAGVVGVVGGVVGVVVDVGV